VAGAGIEATGAVEGPPEGIGAVEPLGATGPESSGWARRLMRTVSFFKGTVDVLTEGLGGFGSLMREKITFKKFRT